MYDFIQYVDVFVGDFDQEFGGLLCCSFFGKSVMFGVVGLVVGWILVFVIQFVEVVVSSCLVLVGFLVGFEFYWWVFCNWLGEIVVDDFWSCVLCINEEVFVVVNWVWQNGFKVCLCGMGYNWFLLLLKGGENCESCIVLVEISCYLICVWIDVQGEFGLFSVQIGVIMEVLLK